MRLIKRAFLLIFLLLPFATLSCQGKDKGARGPSPLIHPDKWLVTGRLTDDSFDNGEVLALALDGMRYRASIAPDNSFGIALPGNASYAVHFLSQAQSAAGGDSAKVIPKDSPPLLHFEESPDVGIRDTLRLPKVLFNRQLDFGEIDIKEKEAYPTINPAIALDFDYDGKNDLSDPDDNGDGLPDEEQKQATERVEVCHTSEDDRSTTQKIPLSTLYHHSSHGDPIGPCQASVAPNPDAGAKLNPFSGSFNASSTGAGAGTGVGGIGGAGAGNSSKKIANDWRPSKDKTSPSTTAADKKKDDTKKTDAKTDDKKKGAASKTGKKDDAAKKSNEDSESSDEDGEEEEEEEDEDSDFYYSDDEESDEEEEDEPDPRDRGDDDDDGKSPNPEKDIKKKPVRKQSSRRGPKKTPAENGDSSRPTYFFDLFF